MHLMIIPYIFTTILSFRKSRIKNCIVLLTCFLMASNLKVRLIVIINKTGEKNALNAKSIIEHETMDMV